MSRKTTKHAHKCKVRQAPSAGAWNSPVGRLMARTTADAAFKTLILDTRIKILMTSEGDDATEILAALATVIGTNCQAGVMQYGQTERVKLLHGALRIVVTLCKDGYKWQSKHAGDLEYALGVAATDDPDCPIDVPIFLDAWERAQHLANLVWSHQVDDRAVAA